MDSEVVISQLFRNGNAQTKYDFDRHNYGRQRSAEEMLLIAVLEDAIDRLQGVVTPGLERKKSDREMASELRWLKSNDHEWPMSFLNVCTALELDPSAVRKQILGGR